MLQLELLLKKLLLGMQGLLHQRKRRRTIIINNQCGKRTLLSFTSIQEFVFLVYIMMSNKLLALGSGDSSRTPIDLIYIVLCFFWVSVV
uniref:Uncharacterized protein n=1 Tax=Medicago truncatula TaxID=3880 RepID=I3S480_MEDTR|nr:unknown [Medicago truncatula]